VTNQLALALDRLRISRGVISKADVGRITPYGVAVRRTFGLGQVLYIQRTRSPTSAWSPVFRVLAKALTEARRGPTAKLRNIIAWLLAGHTAQVRSSAGLQACAAKLEALRPLGQPQIRVQTRCSGQNGLESLLSGCSSTCSEMLKKGQEVREGI
jgi:hypothetical protein